MCELLSGTKRNRPSQPSPSLSPRLHETVAAHSWATMRTRSRLRGVDNCADADLARSARSAIERNAFLPAGKVRPVVRNGWLILVGEVEGPIQKRMAEDAVRDLPGIRGVSNNILIESDALAQRIGQKINEAFVRGALFSAHRISITACDHKIILSGCVRSAVEREEAETAAWAVPGVAQVVNRLRAMA